MGSSVVTKAPSGVDVDSWGGCVWEGAGAYGNSPYLLLNVAGKTALRNKMY